VLGGVDGCLHLKVPSMNRPNQTEPATFSILARWAFFRDSYFTLFHTLLNERLWLFFYFIVFSLEQIMVKITITRQGTITIQVSYYNRNPVILSIPLNTFYSLITKCRAISLNTVLHLYQSTVQYPLKLVCTFIKVPCNISYNWFAHISKYRAISIKTGFHI
jgi:hypothetical protein